MIVEVLNCGVCWVFDFWFAFRVLLIKLLLVDFSLVYVGIGYGRVIGSLDVTLDLH